MFYCIEAVQFTFSAQTKKLMLYCIEAVQFTFSAQTKKLMFYCIEAVQFTCTVCAKKNLPLPFNETERNGSFRSRFIIILFRYLFWIRSRSVRIFRPFWIRFNLFPCCAICFSAWQFMILIKERARMLLTGRMVFSDYTKKRILFYRAKGSHARSHHTHARSHHAHAKSHTYFTSLTFLLLFLPTLSEYCSTGHGFNTESRSTSRLHTSRREALFEIYDIHVLYTHKI